MGQLKPDTKYIYERADGIIYAREFGADPSTRKVVGYENPSEYDPISGHRIDTILGMDQRRVAELVGMAQAAETNLTLQDALERAIMIYQLSKEHE
jgi:hypothetical protein